APPAFDVDAPPAPPAVACPPPPAPGSQAPVVVIAPLLAVAQAFPPEPGVDALALALMVPLTLASPYTARMTGVAPTRLSVPEIVRFWKTRMSTICPPCVWVTLAWMIGACPPHDPIVNACVVELYVPLQSSVAADGGV